MGQSCIATAITPNPKPRSLSGTFLPSDSKHAEASVSSNLSQDVRRSPKKPGETVFIGAESIFEFGVPGFRKPAVETHASKSTERRSNATVFRGYV